MVKSRNLPRDGFCREGKIATLPKPRMGGSTPPPPTHPLRQHPPWALWSPCCFAIMVPPGRLLRSVGFGTWVLKGLPQQPAEGLWPGEGWPPLLCFSGQLGEWGVLVLCGHS